MENDLFYYVQEGIRMSEEMLERKFITISTVDKFRFVEYFDGGRKPAYQEVIRKALQSVQESKNGQ